ncbi:PREDICTED: cytochrome P450 93A3-like isoform X2 [Populus euphratica]|uniref:Cytochrome P450 93A3-like isoform X2 n=1 Tax=Populus euphratica TaxID=75702 RepID=A0AAJ6UNI3_POPEU|nr:PREDICTED: cytochrome P450 93A3-like isoform X2 [Populus euphratica]
MADIQGYIILFLLWLLSTILVRAVLNKTRAKPRLPPSPLALPIIGHLHLLAPLPHQALHKLSTRYGPLIHLFLGSVPCVVASTPETAKEFLKTHENSFCDRPKSAAVDFLTYGSADFSFAPYGPYWKFMKKICMAELLGGRMLDQLLPVRHEEIRQFLQFLLKKANARESIDVGSQLIRLTNNVISRMAMSQRCSDNDDEADEVRNLGFGKRLKEVRKRFDTMMERIIKEHEEVRKIKKETGEGDSEKDLLDILLDLSEDSSEMKLTRENIKAFILDVFVAGTDTSAVTMEWALAELINNPNILERAREEIDSVVGQSRLVQESDIANLPYVQAILKETLRLHPPGPIILRESSESCTINGYEIPARTRLFVNVWAINRDPNYWENPLEFQPERFLCAEENGRNQLDVRGQHFHFLPFGSGRRGCPGTTLALQMVQTGLAAMIQCFDWKVNGTVDMQEGTGITLPRAHPLICVPVARFNPFPSF